MEINAFKTVITASEKEDTVEGSAQRSTVAEDITNKFEGELCIQQRRLARCAGDLVIGDEFEPRSVTPQCWTTLMCSFLRANVGMHL